MHRQLKIIGIAGGLGPHAHVDFERKLLDAARGLLGAAADQDFPEWILSAVPQTPDRTLAIQGNAADPVPFLLRSIKRLEPLAGFIAMPCNTAHHYLPQLQRQCSIPILDMVALTVSDIALRLRPGATVGILATTGTLETRLYHDALADRGFTPLSPLDLPDGDRLQRDLVMAPVYGPSGAGGIKARGKRPEFVAPLEDATGRLIAAGAAALIAACTEIPLALDQPAIDDVPLYDPTNILARQSIRRAYGIS